jgi:tetratricopeptide (TPR) repeat protein
LISSTVCPPLTWRTRSPRPAPGVSSLGGLENAILDEIRTSAGALLWRSVRSVLFWAETPPADRAELFPEGAYERRVADLLELELPAVLVEPCERLAELLSRPDATPAHHIAAGCVNIAVWAREQRKPGTALTFLHAAASCCPYHPTLALMAGREARDQARYRLAEGWLDAAVTVSRSVGNWEIYARAHLAYANMMLARGAFPAARRHGLRARKRAERHGIREVLAMAHHDLFVIAAECGDLTEAHRSARDAMVAYGARHPRLVNLAFDVAVFWMREGYFEVVLPVYRTLLPRVQERFLPHIHGAIARAAGACGLVSEHRQAVRALRTTAVGPGSAEAWLDATHGAINLSAWPEAAEYLNRSLEISRDRKERKIEFLAEALLPRVESRNAAPSLAMEDPSETGAGDLAADLVGLLPNVPAGSAA